MSKTDCFRISEKDFDTARRAMVDVGRLDPTRVNFKPTGLYAIKTSTEAAAEIASWCEDSGAAVEVIDGGLFFFLAFRDEVSVVGFTVRFC